MDFIFNLSKSYNIHIDDMCIIKLKYICVRVCLRCVHSSIIDANGFVEWNVFQVSSILTTIVP